MSSERGSTGSWLLAALYGTIGCNPQEPPLREIPPVVWSGEHLDYAPRAGAYEPCEGSLPYMDRTVGLLAETMEVALDQPVVYVHGGGQGESPCEHESALGCAFDDSVYSLVVPQEHELVHGVRSFERFSHPFFEEGAAELFGDDAPLDLRVVSSGDLRDGIAAGTGTEGLPSSWYPRAGHFMAFLYDRYGSGVAASVLRQTDGASSTARAIEVLEDVTGIGFEQLRQDYEAQPECEQRVYRYPLYGCEEPAALRARCDGEAATVIEERISCDDPGTVGPRDGEMWKTIAFEVPTDGEYLLTAYTEHEVAGNRIVVQECSMRCDSIIFTRSMGIEPAPPVFLRAGRYAMRLTRPVGEAGDVQVMISGGGCE
ncbi:MAG: hypothetical protein KDK70_05430 [Myxococcales bacterium]|nr:hypothetical protein [Myxococcales bacterium]